MTILFLDQFGSIGGAQRCLLDLLPAIRARKWKAICAAPANGEFLENARAAGAQPEPLECADYSRGRKSLGDIARFALEFPRLASRISELARTHRADLIYVNGPRLLPAAVRARGVPVLFHAHNRLSGVGLRVAQGAARSCDLVVACCRWVAEPFEAKARRVRVIFNGAAVAPAARPPAAPPWRIGLVGRLSAEKGQEILIDALRHLAASGLDCRILLCGAADTAADEDQLRKRAAGLPIEFLGFQRQVTETISTLHLLVAPSQVDEATPRVILEAWACGVAVLAFSGGGVGEFVSSGETGFLVAERTSGALARAMARVLGDRAALDRVAASGHARWQKQFTLERFQREVTEAILAAVETGTRPQPPNKRLSRTPAHTRSG